MRIQKFIAESGLCSRREAERLVEEGKIFVNRSPAFVGQDIDPEKDTVYCGGKRIRLKFCNKQYFMFNKPRGVITSMKAQDDRSIVADLIRGIKGRVYPVGRLDRDSEGLLLLTDDGELAEKLTHPKYSIAKTYRVTVKGEVTHENLRNLREGVDIGAGIVTRPAEVVVKKQTPEKTVMHISISEGKNRQIRKMCESQALDVLLLKRIAIGEINLGRLAVGAYRPLTQKELKYLFDTLEIDEKQKIVKKPKDPSKQRAFDRDSRRQNKKRPSKSVYERRFLKQFGNKKSRK